MALCHLGEDLKVVVGWRPYFASVGLVRPVGDEGYAKLTLGGLDGLIGSVTLNF